MQSAIERIINNDRAARERVAAAEQYRRDAAEALAAKKAEADAEMEAELSASAKSAKERSEKKSDGIIAEHRRYADEVIRRMDELCDEKMDEWVETYTRRIIEGE